MSFRETLFIELADTDETGVIYFASLFRLSHRVLEAFFRKHIKPLSYYFKETPYLFPVVHVEGTFYRPVRFDAALEVELSVKSLGNRSFILKYQFYKVGLLALDSEITYAFMDSRIQKSVPLSEELRSLLVPFLMKEALTEIRQ